MPIRYLCGQAAFSSSTNKGRKPQALNKCTSPKVVERDGPSRRLSHSNAEAHLPTPQRLDPQDSRMDQQKKRPIGFPDRTFQCFSHNKGQTPARHQPFAAANRRATSAQFTRFQNAPI
jgi:hypothetical protein